MHCKLLLPVTWQVERAPKTDPKKVRKKNKNAKNWSKNGPKNESQKRTYFWDLEFGFNRIPIKTQKWGPVFGTRFWTQNWSQKLTIFRKFPQKDLTKSAAKRLKLISRFEQALFHVPPLLEPCQPISGPSCVPQEPLPHPLAKIFRSSLRQKG